MTETTRFVSKPTVTILIVLTIMAWMGLMSWANERYEMEQRHECMNRVMRPDSWDPMYDVKMLEFTSNVRACIGGEE